MSSSAPAKAGGSKSRRASPATPYLVKVTPAPKKPRAAATKTKTSTPKQPTIKQLEAQAKREEFELWLLRDIAALRLPTPERQYLFHPTVNYKADLCWARERLIVEVDGGVYLRHGHHNSGKGYEYDRVRDAEALCLGFTVLRVTPGMVKDGTAIDYVERVLHAIWARNKRTA